MKATGIIRKLDELGRVTLPVELRREFNMQYKDPVEIFTDGNQILLKKYENKCVFCGEMEGLTSFKGKNICLKCMGEFGGKI